MADKNIILEIRVCVSEDEYSACYDYLNEMGEYIRKETEDKFNSAVIFSLD